MNFESKFKTTQLMNNNLTILYQKFDSMRQKISTYNFIQIDRFLSTNDCEGIKKVYTSLYKCNIALQMDIELLQI